MRKRPGRGFTAPLQASCAALCGALWLPLVLSLLLCFPLPWRREMPCLDLLYKILSSSPKNCVGRCSRQLAGRPEAGRRLVLHLTGQDAHVLRVPSIIGRPLRLRDHLNHLHYLLYYIVSSPCTVLQCTTCTKYTVIRCLISQLTHTVLPCYHKAKLNDS